MGDGADEQAAGTAAVASRGGDDDGRRDGEGDGTASAVGAGARYRARGRGAPVPVAEQQAKQQAWQAIGAASVCCAGDRERYAGDRAFH